MENEMCSICQEDLIGTSNILTTKCNHKFHTDCYIKYINLSHKNCCPMCRQNIVDDTIQMNDSNQSLDVEYYDYIISQHQVIITSMRDTIIRLSNENKLLSEKNELLENAMNPQQQIQYEEMKMNKLKIYNKKNIFRLGINN